MKRRRFLQVSLATLETSLLFGTGFSIPRHALAADWPADAFHASTLDQALQALFEDIQMTTDGDIEIKARDIAEDGRTVPIEVISRIEGTESITLFAEKNPNPAVASFRLSPYVDAFVSTRIKMGQSGDVIAVVAANGRYFSTRKSIQVTAGGCA